MVNPLLSLDRLASDYCQRWRHRRHSWRHRSEGGFDARRYDVAALSEADAKAFIVSNHYSNSAPGRRSCTKDFKILVIARWLKSTAPRRSIRPS